MDSLSQQQVIQTLSNVIDENLDINMNTLKTLDMLEAKLFWLAWPNESSSSEPATTLEWKLIITRKICNKINAIVWRLAQSI